MTRRQPMTPEIPEALWAQRDRALALLAELLKQRAPNAYTTPEQQATRAEAYALLAACGVSLPGSYEDDLAYAAAAWAAREQRRQLAEQDGREWHDRADHGGAPQDEEPREAPAKPIAVIGVRRGGGKDTGGKL